MKKLLANLFAFSLVELLISLIAISCITAAFAPVISKKLMSNSVSIGSTSNNSGGGGLSPDCTHISQNCQSCLGDTCLSCNTAGFECEERQYKSNLSCACINCPDYDPNCLECDNSGCTKCPEGYYVKNGKCSNCIEGYYCPNGTDLKKCPKGYQCPTSNLTTPIGCSAQTYQSNEAATSCIACNSNQYSPATASACTNCTTTYNDGCTTCTIEGCTGVQSGYYIKSNHSYPISNIQNCASGNSTGCAQCSSGYYLKDDRTCHACSNIAHCTSCNHATSSCLGCVSTFHLEQGVCSAYGPDIPGCASVKNSRCNECKGGWSRIGTICERGEWLWAGSGTTRVIVIHDCGAWDVFQPNHAFFGRKRECRYCYYLSNGPTMFCTRIIASTLRFNTTSRLYWVWTIP